MMYIDFTVDDGEVQRKEYPHHYLVKHVIWETKKVFGRGIKIVTVGCINNAKSDMVFDPAWNVPVQKKQKKTYFGRYI